MAKFLTDDESNKWVLFDLRNEYLIAGCKAMGLICKFITSPLWRLLESKDTHIFDINSKLKELLNYVTKASTQIPQFMSGDLPSFGEVKEDWSYTALVEPSKYDDDCAAMLAHMLPATAELLNRRFEDQLPGGVYAKPSAALRKTTASVPLHNKKCETVFARADFLLRCKPSISTISMEAYVMCSFNKTSDWLERKNVDEQKAILQESYQKVKAVQARFIERKKELTEKKSQLQREKMKQAEEKRIKREQERILQVQEISYYGLWQTEDEVKRNLSSYKTKTLKMDGLKAQLRFRKNILQQSPIHDQSYAFSLKSQHGTSRRDLTVEELTVNLIALVTEAQKMVPTTPKVADPFSDREIEHRFKNEDGTYDWYKGRVISQVF